MLYDNLLKHHTDLIKSIQDLTQRLNSYPAGELICTKNGKYLTYLHSLNGKYTYIPKTNSNLIQQLGKKKLLSATLEDLQRELRAVNAFLKCYQSSSSKVEQLLRHSSYQKLFNQSFQSASEDLKLWSNESYIQNPLHPENLRHPCPSGHIVRSKSEAIIDQALFTHQIPFRYECALELKDATLYPDFTIRHPLSGEYFYWEHFGMMDSPAYAQKTFNKLNIYSKNNIVPTIHLITTYETLESPLTSKVVEDIIQHYFSS